MDLTLTGAEQAALRQLAIDQDLSEAGVLRQALRLYQMHHVRLKAGETVTWSGDARRVRDFVPPADDNWRCEGCGCRGFAEVYGSATQERRCIGCKRVSAPPGQEVNGLLALAIRLHVEGVLSEGQVATAAGLDRVEIRRLSDESKG